MANPVVKVRRETIAACMTCPLCKKLFRDATTISECLHTFCRKCIYNKISDEELECCPICNTDLGCVPLEKLRPDHSLQDVRAKIFPFKRRKVNAPEVMPSTTLPARRKERSLSSLVVSTPRVSTQATMTGKRSRAVARKASALQGSRFSIEKSIKKEGDSVEDHPESSSSPETSNKFLQNTGQSSSPGEPSQSTSIKGTENDVEPWDAKLGQMQQTWSANGGSALAKTEAKICFRKLSTDKELELKLVASTSKLKETYKEVQDAKRKIEVIDIKDIYKPEKLAKSSKMQHRRR